MYVPNLNFELVVSRFEELAISLSVFNPSLCCLLPFHLFFCHSFKAIVTLTGPHYYIILELCNPEFSYFLICSWAHKES